MKLMEKTGRLALAAATIAASFTLAFAATPAAAQTKFPAYTSGVQIANLGTGTATISLTAYRTSDGAQDGSVLNDTIAVNSSKTYFPISNVSAGFSGSIVVGSNQNIAGITNILSADFSAAASYVGRSSGGTTVLLPLLNKNNGGPNGFTTWFSVQNAGTGTANVTVAYSDGTNAAATIAPGAAKVFYQSQETHNAAIFAGTVSSNQPVVVAAIQESAKIMFAYTGFAGNATTNPVFPLVNANNSGFVTGIQIQNAGAGSTSVTLSYTPGSAGTACSETQTIASGASATYALAAFSTSPNPPGATSNCVKGAKFIGSSQVISNSTSQNLVGVGNQLLLNASNNMGEAYTSFSVADAGQTVVMPLIMDRNSGFFTGFSVQNVGTTAVPVNCTFQNTSYTVSTASLAPGAAISDIQNNKIANKYVGAGTCTSSDVTAKLVAVVNQLGSAPGKDQFLVYEGVKK